MESRHVLRRLALLSGDPTRDSQEWTAVSRRAVDDVNGSSHYQAGALVGFRGTHRATYSGLGRLIMKEAALLDPVLGCEPNRSDRTHGYRWREMPLIGGLPSLQSLSLISVTRRVPNRLFKCNSLLRRIAVFVGGTMRTPTAILQISSPEQYEVPALTDQEIRRHGLCNRGVVFVANLSSIYNDYCSVTS